MTIAFLVLLFFLLAMTRAFLVLLFFLLGRSSPVLFPKPTRIRLKGQAYTELIQRILIRDEYRCRYCRTRQHLEVHHIVFRSAGGSDISANLCTLCNRCHRAVHDHKLAIEGDADGDLRFTRA
jgi:hypothetical protein